MARDIGHPPLVPDIGPVWVVAGGRRGSWLSLASVGQQGPRSLPQHGSVVDEGGLPVGTGLVVVGWCAGPAVPPPENARSSPMVSPAISRAMPRAVASRGWRRRGGSVCWGVTVVMAASSGAVGRRSRRRM
jgi:hypothetical protein